MCRPTDRATHPDVCDQPRGRCRVAGIAVRPPDLEWTLVAGGGLLAGIGFTMALFIANLAFSPDVIGEAKLGIFAASAVSAAAGLVLLGALSRTPLRIEH